MATPNEICLVFGLIVSGLFYVQFKKYEGQAKKEELLETFLQG